jgi:hypothetical protein
MCMHLHTEVHRQTHAHKHMSTVQLCAAWCRWRLLGAYCFPFNLWGLPALRLWSPVDEGVHFWKQKACVQKMSLP